MFADDDDTPSDPRHYRRSLVPLNIEDADSPLSLGRRLARLFHRKKKETVSAEGKRSPAGNEPRPLPASRKENNAPPDDAFPESVDSENQIFTRSQ